MLTLIIGGARSGKSSYAQTLCSTAATVAANASSSSSSSSGDSNSGDSSGGDSNKSVVYIATAGVDEADAEMHARIRRHQADRPRYWSTIEAPLDLAGAVRNLASSETIVLVDCITVWLANLSWEHRNFADDAREQLILERAGEFAAAAQRRETIAVTNEVGSGIVPDNPVARFFRDVQGRVNQLLAQEADRVVLVVAGLPLTLKDKNSST